MTAVALNHEIAGSAQAPPVLFGGSLGTTLSMWEPQLELERQARMIRFDVRGHGDSPVPAGPYSIADLGSDVLALMDRLGLARASYCGLSIGGMIGQWLAINAPERIERLVLLCTSAHLPPSAAFIERAAVVRASGSPEVLADAVIGRWFTEPFAAAHPDIAARYRAMIAATAPEGYAGCCEAIAGLDLRAGLPAVSAPTLVVAGAQDPSTPADHGRAIAAAIPGAQLEVLDPCAHLSSVERASDVTRLIANHIRGEI